MITEIFGFDPAEMHCAPCIRAKELAAEAGVEFVFRPMAKMSKTEEHRINKDNLSRRAKQMNFVVKSLPQVFVDGVHIGGADEYQAYLGK